MASHVLVDLPPDPGRVGLPGPHENLRQRPRPRCVDRHGRQYLGGPGVACAAAFSGGSRALRGMVSIHEWIIRCPKHAEPAKRGERRDSCVRQKLQRPLFLPPSAIWTGAVRTKASKDGSASDDLRKS